MPMHTKESVESKKKPRNAAPEATPEMLRLLVDNIEDYAILLLDPAGFITTWTPTSERMNGYRSAEILGKHFSIFYSEEDRASGKCELALETATRDGKSEDEGWRIRKDGSRFWANVAFTALLDSHGKLKGFGKVTRDLTDRKKAEERLVQQSRELLKIATVPVVQVWEGVLLVPLIGMLDSARTQQLMEGLLERLTETDSPVALIDITAVPTIDTQTAQNLIETIKAVRFVGADVILTGVRPAIAQTLVHLGVEMASVTTRSSLAAGLRVALGVLNLRVCSTLAAAGASS